MATSQELVQDFQKANGVGRRLHRLLEVRASHELNWLERWWDDSYLDTRT
jgi:hypothetical protein